MMAVTSKGEVLGRILAHVDYKHIVRHGETTGFFGFFECVDDQHVASSLLDAACRFVSAHGCTELRGPFNLNAYQELGIVLEGFDNPPSVAEIMTAKYYPALLDAAGFEPIKRFRTHQLFPISDIDPESLLGERSLEILKDPAFTSRNIRLDKFKEELSLFRDIYNESFSQNWYFSPRTQEELMFEMGAARHAVNPELIWVAEYHRIPVGFFICMPDVYRLFAPLRGRVNLFNVINLLSGFKKLKEAQFLTNGLIPSLNGRGIMRVLVYKCVKALQKHGFTKVSTTWVDEKNSRALAQVQAIGMTVKHRAAIYGKKITS